MSYSKEQRIVNSMMGSTKQERSQPVVNKDTEGFVLPNNSEYHKKPKFHEIGNTLYVDESNQRVGIGTSSPVAKFVVNGTDKFNVNPDQGATSDIPAGTLVNPLHDLTFATGFSVGDQFTIVYRDDGGSRWNSALEVNSVASGNGNLLLMKGGGNVGIGTSSPNASALLHVSSASKGFLPPVMTGAQVEAISSPATGLMAYATSAGSGDVTAAGWWGYNGSNWIQLG